MDPKWRLEFADASTSGSSPPSNPPGYMTLKELGVRSPPFPHEEKQTDLLSTQSSSDDPPGFSPKN